MSVYPSSAVLEVSESGVRWCGSGPYCEAVVYGVGGPSKGGDYATGESVGYGVVYSGGDAWAIAVAGVDLVVWAEECGVSGSDEVGSTV